MPKSSDRQIIVSFLGIFIALAVKMMSSLAFTETISDKSSLVITIAANRICLFAVFAETKIHRFSFRDLVT